MRHLAALVFLCACTPAPPAEAPIDGVDLQTTIDGTRVEIGSRAAPAFERVKAELDSLDAFLAKRCL